MLDGVKAQDRQESEPAKRMSIPSTIINEIGDVMEEIPVAAAHSLPPAKPRKRIRSRRRLDPGDCKNLELYNEVGETCVFRDL